MRIGIIAALSEERTCYLAQLSNIQEEKEAHVKLWHGEYFGLTVWIAECGIGKVNAAIATTILASKGLDLIINNGSAGALDQQLKVGDIVISNGAQYHDVDMTAFGQAYGQIEYLPQVFEANQMALALMKNVLSKTNQRVYEGLIVSGDTFVSSEAKIQEIKRHIPQAMCTEMEGAAIAQVAYQFNIPYIIVRVMSDTANQDATISFDTFIKSVGKQSAQATLLFLEKLSESH